MAKKNRKRSLMRNGKVNWATVNIEPRIELYQNGESESNKRETRMNKGITPNRKRLESQRV
jgi:hypothetical protein